LPRSPQPAPAERDGKPEAGPLPTVDPLRLVWSLTALAGAVILAYLHAFPQRPYPLNGIAPAAGLVLLSLASILTLARSPWVRATTLAPALMPCVLLLWALWRTMAARVPSEGTHLLGTLLEGALVFTIAIVVAVVGKQWTVISLHRAPDAAGSKRNGAVEPAGSGADAPRVFIDTLLAFFLLLALGVALWALYQYFIGYEQQLRAYYSELRARGRDIADLSPHEWAIYAALRAKRVGSRFGNPNVLAGFLSMAVPLAIGAAIVWKERSAKAAALAILAVICFVIILSGSRGGMLTLLFATAGSILLLGRPTHRAQQSLLAIAAGVWLVAVILGFAVASQKPIGSLEDNSAAQADQSNQQQYTFWQRLKVPDTIAQRAYYLQSGWAMIRRSPFLGHGLGAYSILYPGLKQPLARETRYPHNIVCHLWVELGLIGFLWWSAWVVAVLVIGFRALRRLESGVRKTAVQMLLVATIAYVFNNLFEMTWTFRETYLDWCLLLGLLVGLSAPEKPDAAARVDNVARSLRRTLGPISIAAVPVLLGFALSNMLLIRPMIASSCQMTATELRMDVNPARHRAEIFRLALKAIRYQPRDAQYHDWLAHYYVDLGRVQEAREEFREALRLNPESASVRANLARLERRQEQFDEARRLLNEAIEIYPLNADYHYALYELELEAGNLKAAAQHLRDAVDCELDARQKAKYERDMAALKSRLENNRP
jgi:O-antigen ligase